jgi:hypothetical protein
MNEIVDKIVLIIHMHISCIYKYFIISQINLQLFYTYFMPIENFLFGETL